MFGATPRSFESVLDEFIANGIYPERGPDYFDRPPTDEGKLLLHSIRTVKRVPDEGEVNDYIRRGWFIISLDQRQEPDSRTVYTIYVLGHPELDAI